MKVTDVYESDRSMLKWPMDMKVTGLIISRSKCIQKWHKLQFLDGMNFSGRASYDLVLDWFRGIIID